MQTSIRLQANYPTNYLKKPTGALTYKIVQKKNVKKDGTCPLYLQVFIDGVRKQYPLHLYIQQLQFDTKAQRVRKSHPQHKGFNLIIEKKLALLNKIQINYRLSGQILTVDRLKEELEKPSLRIEYNAYAEHYLKLEKGSIKESTYLQQISVLRKVKRYQEIIFFKDINHKWVKDFRGYLKNTLKNKSTTIASTMKTFKKFVHVANDNGIITPLSYNKISVGAMKGEMTFLEPEELKTLCKYYENEFVLEAHKFILKKYLFSCFTGIRFSDTELIKPENFIGEYLAFTMDKTNKFIRIPLNKGAKKYSPGPKGWPENFTREYINKELKQIARICGINKRLHFHSSRHTFATVFLRSGGRVEVLQKLLGHSKIQTTMIYVHVVESITNDQILLMDQLFDTSL